MSEIGITFDDITLVPQLNEVRSRSEVSLQTVLGVARPLVLKIPLISAPMDTVSSPRLAAEISDHGGLCVLHRYLSIEQQVEQVRAASDLAKNKDDFKIGAAVGSTGDFVERSAALVSAGVHVLCVDVAHGHSSVVADAIRVLRQQHPSIHIMAGNIATAEAYDYLVAAGADSLRVSIGSGSCCETRVNTGHGLPALYSVMDVIANSKARSAGNSLPAGVILDGGIRNPGDIVKSLAVGAHAVMMGSMFAGTDESPGKRININGKEKIVFRGMASAESQLEWRGFVGSEEGTSHYVDPKGPVSAVLGKILNGIRSGFTYTGARDLKEFHSKAKFVRQTISGLVEGRPHIKL